MKKRTLFLYALIVVLFCIALVVPLRAQRVEQTYFHTLVIDPGHGGKDNGSCYDDVLEDEINLNIATKLLETCMQKDWQTTITRTGDYDLASQYAKNRKKEDLCKRVQYINHSGAELFISIHMNIYTANQSVHGPMVYYNEDIEKSKFLAQSIATSFYDYTKEGKPIHSEDFYLFRHTTIPGVLIECGFLSNDEERKKLCNDDYQNTMAELIYKGIKEYFKSV